MIIVLIVIEIFVVPILGNWILNGWLELGIEEFWVIVMSETAFVASGILGLLGASD
ncbi:MAG: hypothetical protein AB8F78_05180 [Saprospiraceae bacterium]